MRFDHDGPFRLAMSILAVASLFISVPASADSSQTWVSKLGNDKAPKGQPPPCTQAAPCRTFAAAIGVTTAGGVINCADFANFGQLTIGKAITISCSAIGHGGIVVTSGNGITINALSTDAVVLDGLEIEGTRTGEIGLDFVNGGALTIRNTTISNFLKQGLLFQPHNVASLIVDNASFVNDDVALHITPDGPASVRATVSHGLFSSNNYGILVYGNETAGSIFVAVSTTIIANSRQDGINTFAGAADYATISLNDVAVSGSGGYGLYANGSKSGMLVNSSTITNNQGGGLARNGGGVIYSYGNNRVNGNNMKDGTFTATLPLR